MTNYHHFVATGALLAAATLAAQAAEPTLISGSWKRAGQANKICLYSVHNGALSEVASATPSADGSFFFGLQQQQPEAFYYIGTSRTRIDRYAFYLKAGERLSFAVNDSSYTLTGTSSAENMVLQAWHDFVQPLEWKAVYYMRTRSTYVDFFPLLETKLQALQTLPPSATGNPRFDAEMERYKVFNMTDLTTYFVSTPRSAHPEGEDFPDYYRRLDLPALTASTALLRYPEGVEIINKIIYVQLMAEGNIPKNLTAEILAKIELVSNDTLRGEIVAMFALHNKTAAGLADYEVKHGKHLATAGQQERVAELRRKLNKATEGVMAPDFTFPDINGKKVSLSDFRGKLVYVDFWATWCGPCKRELPFLKKLEEDYHGNPNVVFLSISTDASKDYEKWKTFYKTNDLRGVQLFAGDQHRTTTAQAYNVTGIPRFVLVGKDGKLISDNAPRPSSEEIRPLLKQWLQ